MADCRSIVERSLRKLGRLGAGRTARTADAEDALEALKGLYKSWIASGAFGRLSDVIPTASFTAGENMRIFRNSDAVESITLPELVPAYGDPLPYNLERDSYDTNYSDIDGSNRPPRDGSVVQVVDALANPQTTTTYLYDGSIRQWQTLDALTLNDPAPRSYDDPEGLAACVATEIADQFGLELPGSTFRQAVRFQSAIGSSFSRPSQTQMGVYC